ncbi:hypothetical protein L5515_000319 [Caenorhabditis briggsae]|uniref:U6 snRNA-associated Sm-like protein LSm6 n=4 Tax=Caenorhabditis TaxID=6237 RepID=A0AAE9J185_CAEBR|nr:hypothetical protein L3Y34_014227 [Caenorhabditis briggsae]UMM10639.1 hypothetical protein L5515_000319 [Caenorhabditis briggsae]
MNKRQNPAEFLKKVIGKPVVVKLNSGVDYRGILACLDGYMNIALEQTEEYSNGQLQNKYGDAFIRGNNVLYISTSTKSLLMRIMPPGKFRLSDTMSREWRTCPRCKNRFLKPEVLNADKHGYTKYWWICENFNNCNFPLDMPSNIYHVTQSPAQKQQKCIPLPEIFSLPEKYHYMYPLTFVNSRPNSRCSSVVSSHVANSRNDTTIDSWTDGTLSEKSSGQNRLKALSLKSGGTINTNSNTPSTSAQSSERGEHENSDSIDEEVEAAAKKSTTRCRVVRRKRYHDTSRSWAALIEKVSADAHTANSIINMEESELFQRMKEFFDAQYFQRTPMAFKRPGIRVTYRVEDVESCLAAVTSADWRTARMKIPCMTVTEKQSLRTATSEELLKSVGIDLAEMKKAVGEKVGKVMRGFSTETLTKRRKIEEERKLEEQQREQTRQETIHHSLSARILNRKMRRDEEERSRASTPASSVHDLAHDVPEYHHQQPQSSHQFQEPAAPVQFSLGEEGEQEQQWGFDLDGLYESIHAQNYQNHVATDPQNPVDAILSQLDEEHQEHPVEGLEHNGEHSGDEQEEEDVGFGDFGASDDNFAADNFGF